MIKAISRFFKTLGRLVSGRINEKTDSIAEDTHVIREEYDEVIARNIRSVRDVRDAVAGLMAQQNKKKDKAERLINEIADYEKKVAGAIAYAKKYAAGKDKAAAQSDPNYVKAMEAYSNFNTTLQEKQRHLDDLQGEIDNSEQLINRHKQQLINLQRDLEKLKQEKHEAVASVEIAKQERELNEALAGIGRNDTAAQVSNLRDRVANIKAQGQVTSELAGTNAALEEQEFLDMAEKEMASSEFDSLIFGEADNSEGEPEKKERPRSESERLPE